MAVKLGLGEAGSRTCVGWPLVIPPKLQQQCRGGRHTRLIFLFFTPFMGATYMTLTLSMFSANLSK
ncbi:hypothetical protein PAHAL_2G037000 [Panicum hallii]|uniref:Uncharacterized protein n=1 Tax=Panicum hallii TaxID=206008 RepID=A0A2T8KMQ9_9POAL|nr:hypothetical protein PAHAL_2G037000 [Panicum hallii]